MEAYTAKFFFKAILKIMIFSHTPRHPLGVEKSQFGPRVRQNACVSLHVRPYFVRNMGSEF